jgi:hypothetical protein
LHIFFADNPTEIERKNWKLFGLHGVMIFFIFACGAFFLPTESQLTKIYLGSYVAQQKDIKNMPVSAAKAFNKLLTNYINKEK